MAYLLRAWIYIRYVLRVISKNDGLSPRIRNHHSTSSHTHMFLQDEVTPRPDEHRKLEHPNKSIVIDGISDDLDGKQQQIKPDMVSVVI